MVVCAVGGRIIVVALVAGYVAVLNSAGVMTVTTGMLIHYLNIQRSIWVAESTGAVSEARGCC